MTFRHNIPHVMMKKISQRAFKNNLLTGHNSKCQDLEKEYDAVLNLREGGDDAQLQLHQIVALSPSNWKFKNKITKTSLLWQPS